mgnify:CR=1 FL=1
MLREAVDAKEFWFCKIGDADQCADMETKPISHGAKDAALAINKMDDKIDDWWLTPEVQSVREEFCYKFAKNLNNPIYEITSAYGHFGRKPTNSGGFTWEKTDKADQISQ